MSTERGFKPIAGVPASDADLDAFAARRGVPTLQTPETLLAPSEPPPRPKLPTPLSRLTLELPAYLCTELRLRAASETCSARYLVMMALRDAGYRIEDADLVADARRTS